MSYPKRYIPNILLQNYNYIITFARLLLIISARQSRLVLKGLDINDKWEIVPDLQPTTTWTAFEKYPVSHISCFLVSKSKHNRSAWPAKCIQSLLVPKVWPVPQNAFAL